MDSRLEALRQLAQDPLNNLVATTLALAIIVLVVLIAALLVLLLLASRRPIRRRRRSKRVAQRPQGARRSAEVSRPVRSTDARTSKPGKPGMARRRRRLMGSLVLGTLLASLVSAYVATSGNLYCAQTCHSMSAAADSYAESVHKDDVSCTRCHEGRFLLAAPHALMTRARDVYYEVSKVKDASFGMRDATCLQCHGALRERIAETELGVRMSHKEVFAAGVPCKECHGNSGHDEPAKVAMTRCLRCHDGKKAAVECETCHKSDPDSVILAKGSSSAVGGFVDLPDVPQCGGCHDQTKCDACHGIRMPHPDDFVKPEFHARPAAFERKQRVCYRCHVERDCQGGDCHLQFESHVSDWKNEHKKSPRSGEGCGCHTVAMCPLCHDW